MRIAIVGLGGVGAYIGAKLSTLKEEHEIIFVARGEHAAAIKAHGLHLSDMDEDAYYHPSLLTDSLDQSVDLLLLCTKTYHSQEALEGVKKGIDKNTLVIPVANGVNSNSLLQGITPASISQACVYVVSHKVAPGHVKKTTKPFALVIDAAYEPLLGGLFEQAGLRVKFSQNIQKELWKKYLFIGAQGSLTSYHQQGMGSIYHNHKEELESLLREIYTLALAKGVALEEKEIDKAMETSSNLPLDAPTSLWLDLQNGANSELESLCHYIILEAQRLQVDVPLMSKIYTKLSQYQR